MDNAFSLTNGWGGFSYEPAYQLPQNAVDVSQFDVVDLMLYATAQAANGASVTVTIQSNMFRSTGGWQNISSFTAFTTVAGAVHTDKLSIASPFGRYLRWSYTGLGGTVFRFFILGVGRQYH